MPTIQIDVPDHLDMQISRLVDDGEFLDQTNAVEDLLSTGIRADG
jgi:Arc/MetJ-type ribon-helix-helix transcriptional regulator